MKKIKQSADRKTVSSKSSVRRHSTAPEFTTFPVEQNMDAIRLTIEETLE